MDKRTFKLRGLLVVHAVLQAVSLNRLLVSKPASNGLPSSISKSHNHSLINSKEVHIEPAPTIIGICPGLFHRHLDRIA